MTITLTRHWAVMGLSLCLCFTALPVYAGRCVVRVQRHAVFPGMCSLHQARTKGSLAVTAMETVRFPG